MSGHNKWSKIKHKKAVTDAKKSREFSKLVRELKAAVKDAGGNADAPAVRVVIDRAHSANMPKNNIERAIKSAQGTDADSVEAVLYEAYGPGGVALLIETRTDNKNRTAPEIKKILSSHGSGLAEPGAAAWAFEHMEDIWKAKQHIPLSDSDKKKLQALVDDLENHDDIEIVITNAGI